MQENHFFFKKQKLRIMKNEQNPAELDQFVDKLLEEAKLPDLAPEVIAQMKSDLLSRVEDRINAALISHMDAEQMKQFDQLLEANSDSEVQQFLKDAIPDLETVIATALISFRSTYLGTNA